MAHVALPKGKRPTLFGKLLIFFMNFFFYERKIANMTLVHLDTCMLGFMMQLV